MRLYTWHEPEFSLVDGRVDHSRSEYCRDHHIRRACQDLWERLGTNQLIWCYVRDGEYLRTSVDTRVKWVLEVPDDKVILTDSTVWNRIIGVKEFAVPDYLRRQWKDEAIARFPHDPDARHRHFDALRRAYYDEGPPPGGWWSVLFIDDASAAEATALFRHPVPKQWVIAGGSAA